ncbi:MAG: hypothetical protein HGA45_21560 [Chloroflexales bacterium]|nr:hypothetical protein [Chloroflexales bacterium]
MPRLSAEAKLDQVAVLQAVRPAVVTGVSAAQIAADKADAQPRGVQKITPAIFLDLKEIHLLDPAVASALAQISPGDPGLPRERVSAPICQLPELTDTALFEDPADAARTFYLPRYRLATRSVSGAVQYAAVLEQRAQGWALTLFLAKYPAPELGAAAQSARELSHAVGVLLRYRPLGGGATTRELAFQESSQAGAELRASLSVGSLPELDELTYALSEPAAQAQLVVRRAVRVALPLPAAGPVLGGGEAMLTRSVSASSSLAFSKALALNEASVVSTMARRIDLVNDAIVQPDRPVRVARPVITPPIVVLPLPVAPALPAPRIEVRPEEEYEAGSKRWVRYSVSVANADAYDDELFAPAADLPPCGNNTNASRTWVNIHASDGRYLYGFCALGAAANLRKLWFAVEAGQSPPPAVYIVLNDRRLKRTVSSNHAPVSPPPPVPRFRELNGVVDCVLQPFYFNRADHAYIFRGAGAGGAPAGGLTPWPVRWGDRPGDPVFNYYQDAARPHLFFYLPERFRLARRPETPYKPFMSVRVAAAPTPDADATVTFTYVAVPWADTNRLAAAAAELSKKVPQLAGAPPELQPLITSAVRFILDRPKAVGSVSEERPLASASVLRSALCDTLTISDRDFQPIFDALMGQGTALFHGKVVVDLAGLPAEEIPFAARLDDMAGGAMLDYAAVEISGGLQVTLTNATESPLRIDDLVATLGRGGGPQQPAILQGLSLPVARLEPGQQISFAATSATPVPGAGALVARFDTDAVRAIPDPEAILGVILDESQLEYYRSVTVVAAEGLFVAPADRPDDQIVEILVDFEEGDFARLTASVREGRARVNHPFADVLLRRPISSTYTYRVTVLRKSGRQTTSDPRQRSEELFYVEVER